MLGDLSRINANVQSLQSLGALNKTNDDLAMRQMRLATGNRINRAEDDSAGYSIAKKLGARVRGQAQAMSNVSDAKNMLTVAEGSLGSVMDILQTMKEKTVQAANDTLGADERAAIQGQLDALRSEVTDILGGTTFNGTALFSDAGDSFNFQVNAESGDSFAVDIDGISADSLLGTVTTTAASGASSNLTGITSGEITGIAFDGAGRLFVADYSYGLARLELTGDPVRARVEFVAGPERVALVGIDGLAAHGNQLIAVQNGVRPIRVLRLHLDDGAERVTSVEVLELGHPSWSEPTLGTVVGDDYYYVANSQWDRFDQNAELPAIEALAEPVILRIDLR